MIGGGGRTAAPAGTTAPGPLALGKSLSSLFDVSGVYGSFLLTPAGDLAARALPEIVDDATLAEVGGRVVRLGETFETIGIDPELCVLRFAEHKLYVKAIAGGALCVVTGIDVSMPALRMAANLVARKVGPDLARLMTSEPPDGDRDSGASSGSPATRMYRGRPIG